MSRPVTRLATGGERGSLSIWDPTNGSLLCESREAEGAVMGVAWSPAGDLLASCSTCYYEHKRRCSGIGSVVLWDTSDDSKVSRVCDVVGAAPSADSDKCSFSSYDSFEEYDRVSVSDGNCPSLCVAFRPELKHEDVPVTGRGQEDLQVLVLSSGMGEKVWFHKISGTVASREVTQMADMGGHGGWVTCMAWSPDGATLATGSEDCTVRLWQVKRDLSVVARGVLGKAHDSSPVSSVAWHSDASTGLVSADGGGVCVCWDVTTLGTSRDISEPPAEKGARALVMRGGRPGAVLRLPEAGVVCSLAVKKGDKSVVGRSLLDLGRGAVRTVERLNGSGHPIFKDGGGQNAILTLKVVAPGGLELHDKQQQVRRDDTTGSEAVPVRPKDQQVKHKKQRQVRTDKEAVPVRPHQEQQQQQRAALIRASGDKTASTGTSASISPDGATLVACIDREIVLWDIDSGAMQRKLSMTAGGQGQLLWSFATDWHTRAKELNALQRHIVGGRFTAAKVRELLNDDEQLVSIKDNAGRLPLHLVLLAAPTAGGDEGDEATDQQAEEKEADELLHVVEMLLEASPAAVEAVDPETADRPLHLATRNPRALTDLFARLLDDYPAAAHELNADGMLPLHTLVKHRGGEDGAAALVGQLLAVNPAAAATPLPEAAKGWLPARLAVQTRATGGVLRRLLEAHPDAAEQPVANGSSQYLLHEALQQRPVVGDAVQVLLEMGPRHTVFQAIRDPKLADAVGRAVSKRPELAWTVQKARNVRAIDDASAECRQTMREALYFLGQYDINSGPAAHISATCVVLFAEDYGNKGRGSIRGGSSQKVALKLMRSAEQFLNEIRSRKDLKSDRVVDYLRLHLSDGVLRNEPLLKSVTREERPIRDSLRLALQRKGEEIRASQPSGGQLTAGGDDSDSMIGVNYEKWLDGSNPDYLVEGAGDEVYCFVMPCADRNLSAAITHERFAGRGSELETIKLIANHLAKALWDMHSSNEHLVHCDVKPLNVVRVGQKWCLIDLDVSCKIGNKFGSKKPSTGYCPPELAALLLKGEHRKYVADVACDMWAFGCVLFHLCTSETLWHTDQDDNIKEHDLELVAGMGDGHGNMNVLERRLQLVGQRLGASEKHKRQAELALDLLRQLLTPSQEERREQFHSFEKILMHPFLTGEEGVEVPTATKEMLSRLNAIRRVQEDHGRIIRDSNNLLHDVDDKMGVMLRAMRMQSRMLMELLLEEDSFPSLVIFLPPRPPKGALRKALPEWVANPRLLFAQEVRLFFVCSVSMEVAQTNNGEGFPITIKREWLRKAAPYLRAGLMVFRTAVVAGRAAGIPILGLDEGIVKILDAMKSVVNEELEELTVDGERMGDVFDKISEHASKQASKDGAQSDHGTNSFLSVSSVMMPALKDKMKRSTRSLNELLADQPDWHARSGLKKAFCSGNEQVVWCLPEYETHINRESKASVAQIWNAPTTAPLTVDVQEGGCAPEPIPPQLLKCRGTADAEAKQREESEIQRMRQSLEELALKIQQQQGLREIIDQKLPSLVAEQVQMAIETNNANLLKATKEPVEPLEDHLQKQISSVFDYLAANGGAEQIRTLLKKSNASLFNSVKKLVQPLDDHLQEKMSSVSNSVSANHMEALQQIQELRELCVQKTPHVVAQQVQTIVSENSSNLLKAVRKLVQPDYRCYVGANTEEILQKQLGSTSTPIEEVNGNQPPQAHGRISAMPGRVIQSSFQSSPSQRHAEVAPAKAAAVSNEETASPDNQTHVAWKPRSSSGEDNYDASSTTTIPTLGNGRRCIMQ